MVYTKIFPCCNPVNMRYWADVGPMLARRLRRRPNIGPTSANASCLLRKVIHLLFAWFLTHRIETIADPLGYDERHDNRQAECDVSCTLDEDNGQADGHPHGAPELTRRPYQSILPYVITLQITRKTGRNTCHTVGNAGLS